VFWLLACGGAEPSDPVADALRAEGTVVADCATAFEELRITCLVDVAAGAARAGEDARADAACSAIAPGVWRQECHFRAGEEHGVRGDIELALDHCGRAGRFAGNCVTHAAWRMRPVTTALPSEPTALAEIAAFTGRVDTALAGVAEVRGIEEAREALLARAWFHLYYGSGSADRAALDGAVGDQQAAARTAWAMEALRLDGSVGEPLDPRERVGRYAPALIPPGTEAAERVPTFGGGQRLVGPTPLEDEAFAAVAAAYFLGWDGERILELGQGSSKLSAIGYAVLASPELGAAFESDDDPAVRAMAREARVVRADMDLRRRSGDR